MKQAGVTRGKRRLGCLGDNSGGAAGNDILEKFTDGVLAGDMGMPVDKAGDNGLAGGGDNLSGGADAFISFGPDIGNGIAFDQDGLFQEQLPGINIDQVAVDDSQVSRRLAQGDFH